MKNNHYNFKGTSLIFIIIIIVYCVIYFFIPKHVFWITDEGNRLILLKNIDHYASLNIEKPFPQLDPEARLFPVSGMHFVKIKEKLYSIYSAVFPLLNLPLFHFMGYQGIYLIALISSFLLFFAMYRLGRELNLKMHPIWGVIITSFCTPILFYSFTYWEHTLSTLLVTIGLIFLLGLYTRSKNSMHVFVSGLAIGLVAVLREEGYLLFTAFFAALVLGRYCLSAILCFLLGFTITLLPLWLYYFNVFGSPFGIHAYLYLIANAETVSLWSHGDKILQNLYYYVFQYRFCRILSPCDQSDTVSAFAIK